MAWWVWLLVGWAVLSTAAGVYVGAVAAEARARERVAREHRGGDD